MSKVTLREYQLELIDGARREFRAGHNSCVLVLPTGGGKGKILPAIAAPLVSAGKRVLILAHRAKLIKQLCESLDLFDVCYDKIGSSRRQRYHCAVGMVETVRRRLEKMHAPDYILVDETHHAVSSQYKAIFDFWPDAKIIGVTATPARTDDKGLGDVFSAMVIGPTMRWLIDNGFLAHYAYYAPPAHIDMSKVRKNKEGDFNEADAAEAIRISHVVGDAIKHYRDKLNGKQAIVFCTGIQHAKDVALEFNEAGIRSAHIDGTMKESEQDDLMEKLEKGEIDCLMSADLIGEGVDIPSISGIIMLRPTDSVVVFLQQCGRALRLKKDGSHAIILDHVGNCQRHGYPADPREWSLEGKVKKVREVKTVTCEKCYKAFHSHEVKEAVWSECGETQGDCPLKNGVQKIIVQTVQVIEEELIAVVDPWAWTGGIDPVLARGEEYENLIAKADTEDKLKMIGRARGYKPQWWQHVAVSKGLRKKSRFRSWK